MVRGPGVASPWQPSSSPATTPRPRKGPWRPSPASAAFAHRHQNVNVAAAATGPTAPFDTAWESVRPTLDGLYLSFETAFSPLRRADAFPPATLQRLREVNRKIDPDNVFHQNFPVT